MKLQPTKMKSTEELRDDRYRERTSTEDSRILAVIGLVVIGVCVAMIVLIRISGA